MQEDVRDVLPPLFAYTSQRKPRRVQKSLATDRYLCAITGAPVTPYFIYFRQLLRRCIQSHAVSVSHRPTALCKHLLGTYSFSLIAFMSAMITRIIISFYVYE